MSKPTIRRISGISKTRKAKKCSGCGCSVDLN